MKTDELIAVLSAGTTPIAAGAARRRLLLACLIGVVGAAVLVFAILRPRDLIAASRTGTFWMKVGYGAWLGAGGYLLADRAARPGARLGAAPWLTAAPLAIAAAMAVNDLAWMPASAWRAAWMGASAGFCPIAILVAATPVFIAVAAALRRLAPTRLRFAGAAAGLLAGGLGAAVYALWCREPSAVFVASWYTLGIAACAGLGALLGPRALRW
jgi:hypothetical protein